MFRFIHAADAHLDSPLLNLGRYDGAPIESFRSATRRAFDNLVRLAIAEQVDFVVIAGDLYDGDCADFNTPLHFRRKMEELQACDIQVYLLQGNHDAASKMKKAFRLELPENVTLFPTNKPATAVLEECGVALHGQGFAQQAVEDPLHVGYPEPRSGYFNLGVLHTNCGEYETHDNYAPSTVQGLTDKGYDYWALGHIHKRAQLAGPEPHIWYPGNLQGRSIREQGPKGCSMVTVGDDHSIDVRFEAVDVLRWQACQVDATPCPSANDVTDAIQQRLAELLEQAEGRPLAGRVEITGRSPAHRELSRYRDKYDAEIRTETVDRFDDQVWLEKIQLHTEPVEVTSGELDSSLLELVQRIDQSAAVEEVLAEVREDVAKLQKLLPADKRADDVHFDLGDPERVSELLRDAKDLLVSRLLESGGAA